MREIGHNKHCLFTFYIAQESEYEVGVKMLIAEVYIHKVEEITDPQRLTFIA